MLRSSGKTLDQQNLGGLWIRPLLLASTPFARSVQLILLSSSFSSSPSTFDTPADVASKTIQARQQVKPLTSRSLLDEQGSLVLLRTTKLFLSLSLFLFLSEANTTPYWSFFT
jgi:hypothetical protein